MGKTYSLSARLVITFRGAMVKLQFRVRVRLRARVGVGLQLVLWRFQFSKTWFGFGI